MIVDCLESILQCRDKGIVIVTADYLEHIGNYNSPFWIVGLQDRVTAQIDNKLFHNALGGGIKRILIAAMHDECNLFDTRWQIVFSLVGYSEVLLLGDLNHLQQFRVTDVIIS